MDVDRHNLAFSVAVLLLLATLIVMAFRFENRFSTVERQLLARSPAASPLKTLSTQPSRVARSQSVYVPVYSHVYRGNGDVQALETTLSIRNTDPRFQIVVNSIRYYDNDGALLREYLETPVLLDPLASADFLVERRDMAGGVGANFLVDWVAEESVSPPRVETVMVSFEDNRAFAFARSGHPIDASTEPAHQESVDHPFED